MSDAVVPKKKGPGRPKKNTNTATFQVDGIVNSIDNKNICMRFISTMPYMFFQICKFYKQLKSDSIQILFRKTEIIIFSIDHFQTTYIRCRIDGNKLNQYYNRIGEIKVEITEENIDTIMKVVNKDYKSIEMYLEDKDLGQSINIILIDDLNTKQTHKVELTTSHIVLSSEMEKKFEDEDYAINFTLHDKYFKKLMSSIDERCKENCEFKYNTQEDNQKRLTIEYTSDNKKIVSKHHFCDNQKIYLVDKLDSDDNVNVEMTISQVKSIANAYIFDTNVKIFIDENKDFMTKCDIGGTLSEEVKTTVVHQDSREETKEEVVKPKTKKKSTATKVSEEAPAKKVEESSDCKEIKIDTKKIVLNSKLAEIKTLTKINSIA